MSNRRTKGDAHRLILYGIYENRPENRFFAQPFYIGIGTPERPLKHLSVARRGLHFNRGVQRVCAGHFARGVDPRIQVLAILPNRDYARLVERNAIRIFGRRRVKSEKGCLCNIAKGGDGPDAELMRDPRIRRKISRAGRRTWRKEGYRERQCQIYREASARPETRRRVSEGTRRALNRPETRDKHVEALKLVNAGLSSEKRSEVQKQSYANNPDRRRRVSEAQREVNARPGVRESKSLKSTAMNIRTWADPAISQRRISGMQGKKKTMTPAAIAARRLNQKKAVAARLARPPVVTPEHVAALRRNIKVAQAAANSPSALRARAERMREQNRRTWNDPLLRDARMAALMRSTDKMSEASLRAWADPQARERRIENMRAAARRAKRSKRR